MRLGAMGVQGENQIWEAFSDKQSARNLGNEFNEECKKERWDLTNNVKV